jgi:hypothetical protein
MTDACRNLNADDTAAKTSGWDSGCAATKLLGIWRPFIQQRIPR